jgi:hypothetical protein
MPNLRIKVSIKLIMPETFEALGLSNWKVEECT